MSTKVWKSLPFICFAALIAFTTTAFAVPENLDILKTQIENYYNSGQYTHDIEVQISKSQQYLAKRIKENQKLQQPKKLAIVLDIDETSLSNYADMKKLDFGGTYAQIDAMEADGDDPAITPTLDLYKYALQHHVAVFFVTGRREKYRAPTVNNLKQVGYTTWTKLFMKPNNYDKSSVIPYKSAIRKKIESMGYDIVLNIGDQNSDLSGGYADKDVKLADPFYLIP